MGYEAGKLNALERSADALERIADQLERIRRRPLMLVVEGEALRPENEEYLQRVLAEAFGGPEEPA